MFKNILVLIVTLCMTTITPAQVAVAVGGGWGGVAVATGGYGGYYGGVVAPVGGWYRFGYASSFCASPVPQVLPVAQPVSAYTVSPAYVQPIVVQQAPAVRQTVTEVVEKKSKKERKPKSSKECTCSCKK